MSEAGKYADIVGADPAPGAHTHFAEDGERTQCPIPLTSQEAIPRNAQGGSKTVCGADQDVKIARLNLLDGANVQGRLIIVDGHGATGCNQKPWKLG
ncbi:MAG: hypothetical protein ACI9TH_004017 [Kiritimatiellia bacterium]